MQNIDGEKNKNDISFHILSRRPQKTGPPSLAIINTLPTSPYMSSQAVEKLLRSEKLIITAHWLLELSMSVSSFSQ